MQEQAAAQGAVASWLEQGGSGIVRINPADTPWHDADLAMLTQHPGAALMLRVVVEGIQDPSRHNLWPLALIIVVVLGVVVAAPGAVVARLLSRVLS